jgi:PTS system mannose-specific IIA component
VIGALVVTHGNLARELVGAACRILGPLDKLEAVPIAWEEDVESARRLVLEAIDRVSGPEGVLILTDMFGGTPANISLSFLESGKVEIVTGVNLPMLIRLCKMRAEPRSLEDVAQGVWAGGRDHIRVATSALKRRGSAAEEAYGPDRKKGGA